MTVLKIAMSGKMRSGKDTFAARAIKYHGFRRFAFADKLKEMAEELFGLHGKSRGVLIAMGRKMCEIDREVWVKYVLERIPADCNVVITDMRFEYEYEALKEAGFTLIRVLTDLETQQHRLQLTQPDFNPELINDPSETALDNHAFDRRIDGRSSLARFNINVDRILRSMRRDIERCDR